MPSDKNSASVIETRQEQQQIERFSNINALGFLLGDKKAGPFELEVEWIRVVSAHRMTKAQGHER